MVAEERDWRDLFQVQELNQFNEPEELVVEVTAV